jgi:threonine/homoserine/homoserine lactone efflux protein
MSDLYSLMAGIILGLTLAVPPGPVNALIAAESARRSWISGILADLGSMTADLTFLILTVVGVTVLLTGSLARNIISALGGLILLYFAIDTLKSYRGMTQESGDAGAGNPYVKGLVMGLTNPLGILWWVTAGAAFIALFNVLGVIGFMLGLLLWGCCFSVFVHYTGEKVKAVYPVVVIGSGLIMLICALLLLYGAANSVYSFIF